MQASWVQFAFNNDGGLAGFNQESRTIALDTKVGHVVFDDTGHAIGLQSLAIGISHEGFHATNPNLTQDRQTQSGDIYGTVSERKAVQGENQVAGELNQPARTNHFGVAQQVGDPTEHTDNAGGNSRYVSGSGQDLGGNSWQGMGSGSVPYNSPDTTPNFSPPANPDAIDPREWVFDGSYGDYLGYGPGWGWSGGGAPRYDDEGAGDPYQVERVGMASETHYGFV